MKISIQRQCDGMHPDLGDPKETCEARVEITYEMSDDAIGHAKGRLAYERAMVALAWRRVGGSGGELSVNREGIAFCIPDTRRWVVCPDHAKGMVCATCGFADCSCMGGPRFDVVIDRSGAV